MLSRAEKFGDYTTLLGLTGLSASLIVSMMAPIFGFDHLSMFKLLNAFGAVTVIGLVTLAWTIVLK